MTSTERLIEAVTYASESDMDWWDLFDSMAEAKKVITAASRQAPDENQIACMLAACDDEDMDEMYTPEETYDRILKNLKKELRTAKEEE